MRATHRLAPRPELAREGTDGVIGRSETRDTPRNPVAILDTALLFGTRVAKPILAAVMCDVRPLDRTYDRKRSDPRAAPSLAGWGPSTYGFRLSLPRAKPGSLGRNDSRGCCDMVNHGSIRNSGPRWSAAPGIRSATRISSNGGAGRLASLNRQNRDREHSRKNGRARHCAQATDIAEVWKRTKHMHRGRRTIMATERNTDATSAEDPRAR